MAADNRRNYLYSALKQRFKKNKGDIIKLITASEAPWTNPIRGDKYVTDGPFLFPVEDGTLVMLWSSFKNDIYAIGLAHSVSGKITGPWAHKPETLFPDEGGHCMLFRDFSKKLYITYHSPNKTPLERPLFRQFSSVLSLTN